MPKDLKAYLDSAIAARIADYENRLVVAKASRKKLAKLDPNNALYHVSVISLWQDEGGKNAELFYTGNLKTAIKETVKLYREKNNVGNTYKEWDIRVSVHIDNDHIAVPEEYWKKYAK